MSLRDELIEAIGRRNVQTLSRVLAARGLKVTAREATEGMVEAGCDAQTAAMWEWQDGPRVTRGPDQATVAGRVWQDAHDAAPDLLGDRV